MNRLSNDDRTEILQMLCEGMSIRATTRLTGASKNTVAKLLFDAGEACAAYHDANVRNVKAKRVLVDEIWSFTYAKQENVAKTKAAKVAGDTWTWTALDADSKMILSYLVGGRDAEYAMWFMDDLRERLANRMLLTSDGHRAYLEAFEGTFVDDLGYDELVEMYGPTITAPCRYGTAAKKVCVTGNPNVADVSTSYVNRPNLTMRMHIRRFTRLTNAFSRKVENHARAVALHMMYYNFFRTHKTLRVTPAMAAGITDRLWEIGDIARLVADAEGPPKKRGSYIKLAS
ncbi:DDE-type integrase/transposase/recombinase [Sphingomonas asaccharolytica]|uniref:DDE-type integrase/transposase/recombinase n=1 Tax=Sphingomonas asaccharolytica TaxID=40681 RepID=UPI00082A4831|nr:DDE-type integrase/transposase/recombinase [Sphingomonas asaccharolytica]